MFFKKLSHLFGWEEFEKEENKPFLLVILILILISFIDLKYFQGLSVNDKNVLNYFPAFWQPKFLTDYLFPSAKIIKLLLNFSIVSIPISLVLFYKKNVWKLTIFTSLLWFLKLLLYGQNILSWEVYEHAFFIISFFVIFLPKKRLSFRISLSLVYFLAGITKLNPSWLSGEVFFALPDGYLPLVPDNKLVLKILCWALMLSEILTPFVMFSKWRAKLTIYWVTFHIYTILFLGSHFPVIMLAFLVTEFNLKKDNEDSLFGHYGHLILSSILVLLSLVHLVIPGAKIVTSEWKMAGLFMFDGSVLCDVKLEIKKDNRVFKIHHLAGDKRGIRTETRTIRGLTNNLNAWVVYSDGRPKPLEKVWGRVVDPESKKTIYNGKIIASRSYRTVCSPYVYFNYLKLLEEYYSPDSFQLKVNVKINGSEKWFNTIDLNSTEIKDLSYKVLGHNPWIKYPRTNYPSTFLWP